ncbi:hypothetical protein Tco_0838800 [Tanacetum coccineum]|uniref:Uncharacterized protein n=1 Tax=Tanacetum coccineum TaxID=301880 RepID=A0ABQ5AT17_9ASTR
MHLGKSQSEHIDEFHKLVCDLAAIDAAISVEDQALLQLTSLPSSYDNFKMAKAKGDGGEGLYMRGRFGQRYTKQGTDSEWSKSLERSSKLMCYICHFEEHLKRDCDRVGFTPGIAGSDNSSQERHNVIDDINEIITFLEHCIVETDKVTHTVETDKVKQIVDVESSGKSADEIDKETVSFGEMQLKQEDQSCVHASIELHLHAVHVVPSEHESDQH